MSYTFHFLKVARLILCTPHIFLPSYLIIRINRFHDLSRVADGFKCRRCDGIIQEVDLAEDLMVDGETYEYVKSFCYLGDTLDGADIAATARIGNGWMKFRELLTFLTFRAPPLEMKGRVYASCV